MNLILDTRRGPVEDRKLLEQGYNAREAFEIPAPRIIPASEQTLETQPRLGSKPSPEHQDNRERTQGYDSLESKFTFG